jgi:hypothetical protein
MKYFAGSMQDTCGNINGFGLKTNSYTALSFLFTLDNMKAVTCICLFVCLSFVGDFAKRSANYIVSDIRTLMIGKRFRRKRP